MTPEEALEFLLEQSAKQVGKWMNDELNKYLEASNVIGKLIADSKI